MIIENKTLPQDSQEWLDFRVGKFTASNTSIVLGESQFKSISKFKKEWLGIESAEVDPFVQSIMQHGKDYEPKVREIINFELDTSFEQVTAVYDEDERFMASLDGYSKELDIILEIKCPFKKRSSTVWKDAENGIVSKTYYSQVQHQLMCSGASKALFAVCDTDTMDIKIMEVLPDESMFDRIQYAWNNFAILVSQDAPQFPPQLADIFKDLKKKEKSLKDELKIVEEATNDIARQLQPFVPDGAKEFESFGVTYKLASRQGVVDYKALLNALSKELGREITQDFIDGFRKETSFTHQFK